MLQKWRPPPKTSITARRAQTPATDGLAPVEADLNITVLVSDYIKRNRRQKLACIYRSKVASSLWSWVQHTLKTKHWFNLVITFFGKVSGQEKYAGHHFWKHPFRLKSFETCESQARSVHLFFFRTVAHLILLWLTTTTIAVCPYGHQREEQTGWVALFSPTSRAVEAEKVDLYNTWAIRSPWAIVPYGGLFYVG